MKFLRYLFASFVLALPFGVNAETPDDPNQVRPLLPGMAAPVFNVQRADGIDLEAARVTLEGR